MQTELTYLSYVVQGSLIGRILKVSNKAWRGGLYLIGHGLMIINKADTKGF